MIQPGLIRSSGLRATEEGINRRRLQVVVALVLGAACVLAGRLALIQVVEGSHFRAMAADEHFRRTVVPPRRGNIFDSLGHPLAVTVTYQRLYATTSEIGDPKGVAARLGEALGDNSGQIALSLGHKQSAPTLIKTGIPIDVADTIRQMALPGLYFQDDPGRAYPQGALLDQVLGVDGVDNNGLSGLELRYNADLAGKPGSLVAERDSSGDAIALGPHLFDAPIDGSSLTLTIDRYVQWVVERELSAITRTRPSATGTIVVIDPRTGAILGMASRPTFLHGDPDLYSSKDILMYSIPAVASSFEPGPVFELVTMAAALETGAVTAQSSFVNTGSIDYAGHVLSDSTSRSAGPMSMSRALNLSSRVGMIWAAARVGAPKFYRVVADFGLGRPTGIDLPGEAAGLLRQPTDLDWNSFDLAQNASGYGLEVPPVQLASAVATVASGGLRFRPFIVRTVQGPGGPRIVSPVVDRRVIRGDTASALTRMLVSAVDDPTSDSRGAAVPGYSIAGVGGFSQPTTGHSGGSTSESFLGFGPAERPRFAIYVRIDAPSDISGRVAQSATLFGAIARQLMGYYQIPPTRSVSRSGT